MWVIKGLTQCGPDKLTSPVSGLKGPNFVVTDEWRSSSDWEILDFVPADEMSWSPQNDWHMRSVPNDLISLSLDVSVQPLAFFHLMSKQNNYQGCVQLVFGKDPVWTSVATVLVDNYPLKNSDFFTDHQIYTLDIVYVLPTQCIYVFYVGLRTNSDYLPIQH
jgi:hypothetical protein